MPRIAIIDDDLPFLELMQDVLADVEGNEVLTSSDWFGSLEFVQNWRPDLIILDLMLGRGQNGLAVLEQLQGDPNTSSIPVIVCTAAVPLLTQYAERLDGPTVQALPKPFDLDHLLEMVDRVCSQRTGQLQTAD